MKSSGTLKNSRKKLEITVVDARPMSQSGFVDQHSAQKHGQGEWSLTYGNLHPSQSVDNLLGETDLAFGAERKLAAPSKRPTIIRPSKSNDNLKNDARRPGGASTQSASDLLAADDFSSLQDSSRVSPGRRFSAQSSDDGTGVRAVVNPGFRLESDKRVPAPPRPRKKAAPPRPPPIMAPPRPREVSVRSRCAPGEDDLINFDPFAPSPAGSGNEGRKSKTTTTSSGSMMCELEEIFANRPPDPGPPPPKPLRANSRTGSRPTSLVRPMLTVPHGTATFDFEGQEQGDLQFQTGDTIRLMEKKDEQWFVGCNLRTHQEGLFPFSFVEVKVPLVEVPEVKMRQNPVQPIPKPRVSSFTEDRPKPLVSPKPPPAASKPTWPPTSSDPLPVAALKPTWPPTSSDPPAVAALKPTWPPAASDPPPVTALKPTWPAAAAEPPLVTALKPTWPPATSKPVWPPRGSPNAEASPPPVAPKPSTLPRRSGWPPPVATVNPEPPQQPPPPPPTSQPPPVSRKPKPPAPHCRALYAYQSGETGDLRFDAGDIIHLLGRESEDWLRGELRGQVGIFPKTFVRIEEDLPSPAPAQAPVSEKPAPPTEKPPPPPTTTASVLFEVKAVFDYQGPEGDLAFRAGDRIRVTKVVDKDWMEGELDERKGLFPTSFVENMPNAKKPPPKSPPPPPPPKQVAKAKALYSFQAQTSDDLAFQENDIITLKEEVDSDWLRGELNGCVGMFPKSFVTILVPL